MIKFDFDKFCYGCTACASICPVSAITLEQNNEGFIVPKVNEDKCIQCNACERICIFLNPLKSKKDLKSSKFNIMSLTNIKELLKSTSGGAFYAIAKHFIENEGYVCGCAWNKEMKAEHIIVNTLSDLEKLQGSKYVQSDIKACMEKVKILISEGKKVLFSGTPCQVEAIKRVVNNSELLFTCSLYCEGVPSPKVLDKHIKCLEERYNSKIIDIKMREKKPYGWNAPRAEYQFLNQKKLCKLSYLNDEYIESFIQGLFMRKSCFNCHYKGSNIEADFILGDYWGANYSDIKSNNNQGLSSVIVRTQKADELINKVQNIHLMESSYEKAVRNNNNLITSIKENEHRDEFFKNIDDMDFLINVNRFINYNSIKMKATDFFDKTRLYKLLRFIRNRRIR